MKWHPECLINEVDTGMGVASSGDETLQLYSSSKYESVSKFETKNNVGLFHFIFLLARLQLARLGPTVDDDFRVPFVNRKGAKVALASGKIGTKWDLRS